MGMILHVEILDVGGVQGGDPLHCQVSYSIIDKRVN